MLFGGAASTVMVSNDGFDPFFGIYVSTVSQCLVLQLQICSDPKLLAESETGSGSDYNVRIQFRSQIQ